MIKSVSDELVRQEVLTATAPATAVAVGNDLVHLPTFHHSFTPLFIRRGYTPAEIAYCAQFMDTELRFASTWAAKEAVYKLVKQVDGTLKLWWRDIEIRKYKLIGIGY